MEITSNLNYGLVTSPFIFHPVIPLIICQNEERPTCSHAKLHAIFSRKKLLNPRLTFCKVLVQVMKIKKLNVSCWVYFLVSHTHLNHTLLGLSSRRPSFKPNHYNDVIMGAMSSQITDVSLFVQLFVHAQINENIKVPHHWPLRGKSTGNRWIPLRKCR